MLQQCFHNGQGREWQGSGVAVQQCGAGSGRAGGAGQRSGSAAVRSREWQGRAEQRSGSGVAAQQCGVAGSARAGGAGQRSGSAAVRSGRSTAERTEHVCFKLAPFMFDFQRSPPSRHKVATLATGSTAKNQKNIWGSELGSV